MRPPLSRRAQPPSDATRRGVGASTTTAGAQAAATDSLIHMRPSPDILEVPRATSATQDVLTPKEIARRSSFSYQAILRAIRRGDLRAYEPVPGRYRIALAEYERWLRTPRRAEPSPVPEPRPRRRRRDRGNDADPGSFARLTAIDRGA